MPLPEPNKNETEQDFVSRCIGSAISDNYRSEYERWPSTGRGHVEWRDAQKPKKQMAGCSMGADCPMEPTDTACEMGADCPMGIGSPMNEMAVPLRAWSTFTLKSTTETKDERILEGIASTPATDRVGDIVEPLGAKFTLPLPFLWQHDHKAPIGRVIEAKVTAAGIWIKAQIAKVTEPGRLKDRVDEAWHSFKHGVVGGLSIGFRGTDVEPIDKKAPFGGQRFKEWSLYEVSAVTIPANAEASITTIRSIDQGAAVSGNAAPIAKPAAVVAPRKTIKIERAGAMAKVTNSERIKDLENKRAAEVAAREAIHEKVTDENRTKDEAEQQQFDEHSATIKAIDRELADCRLMEKELIATARPVNGGNDGVEIGNPHSITVSSPKLPPGIPLMKLLACKAHAQMYSRDVMSVARQFCSPWPEIEMSLKAAVATGTTVGTTWAAPLVYPTNIVADFVEFLVPQTFLGRIPGLVRVPFNSRIPRENSVITAQWVGEGRAKPVAAGSFDSITLTFAKTACIMGVTDELARFSSPSVEMLVRNNLAKGISKFLDTQFLSNTAAVSGVSPAGILNGADTDSASGTDITAVIHDIREILFHFQEYNIPTDNLVLLMQPVLATSIGTMMTTLGVRQFPDINGQGGSILGVPVITSNNVPSGYVAALNPPSIAIADEGGGLQIDVSREASVELADNPTTTDYHLVSAFQQNLMFVRAEQYITWARLRDKGAYYLTGAAYGGAVTG